jgi:hypothetical protein
MQEAGLPGHSMPRRVTSDRRIQIPAEFLGVVRDPALRRHLRSATDSYFSLGDHAVEVHGGWLVHFLLSSQWIRH